MHPNIMGPFKAFTILGPLSNTTILLLVVHPEENLHVCKNVHKEVNPCAVYGVRNY